ncbi:hypothetical protein M8994_17270 [Brucella sp. 21LCYQ03]|nr:hypothetical protein [Brucella sp. 21LCYQ03]
MPRIQCLLGPATDVYIGGTAYNFENDRYGRAVAEVADELHVRCLISIEHYRLVPDDMLLGDPAMTGTALSPLGGGEPEDDDDDEDDGNGLETTLLLGGQSFTPGITQPENGNANPAGGEGDGSGEGSDKTVTETDTDLNKTDSTGQNGDNSGAGAGTTEHPVTPATTTTTPAAEPVKVEKPKQEDAPKSRGRPKKADAATKPSGE